MTLKENFYNIQLVDIQDFVNNKVAEDLFLEFKTANFPVDKKYDEKNFSKCLSGFANSSGGILVWGVKASSNSDGVDVAHSLKPIKELLKFENLLKRNEGSTVIPTIDRIEYRRIEIKADEGFLLVYIPPSERAPHMALHADKRYYKRSGDSFYICEHFDIIDIIQRKTVPKLKIGLRHEYIGKVGNPNEKTYKYQSVFCVENVGQVSAKHIVVFIKVNLPFRIADYGIDGNGHRGMSRVVTKDSFTKYAGGSDLVLHPDTFHEVDKITLNEIGNKEAIEDLRIEYKVIAEGTNLLTGEISMTMDELIKLTSA